MSFKRKFRTDFFIENQQIRLSENYRKNAKFKKITGTRLASCLGEDKYRTPLQTWAILTNIYDEVIEPTFAAAGKIIEAKLLKYVQREIDADYRSYDPVDYNWDLFADNKVFGGIPDAEAPNLPMLEFKTSSIDDFEYIYDNKNHMFVLKKDHNGVPLVKLAGGKYRKWFVDGKINIPITYKMQLGLYLYLRQQTEGMFAVCFLQKDDYAKPVLCDVNQREIVFEKMHLDLDAFAKYIDCAQQWYKNYVLTGISPVMTNADIEWFFKEVGNNGK